MLQTLFHLHGDSAICGGACVAAGRQPRLRRRDGRRVQRRVQLCLLLQALPLPPPPRRRPVQPQPRFVHLRRSRRGWRATSLH